MLLVLDWLFFVPCVFSLRNGLMGTDLVLHIAAGFPDWMDPESGPVRGRGAVCRRRPMAGGDMTGSGIRAGGTLQKRPGRVTWALYQAQRLTVLWCLPARLACRRYGAAMWSVWTAGAGAEE